jgi:hypothetical protein
VYLLDALNDGVNAQEALLDYVNGKGQSPQNQIDRFCEKAHAIEQMYNPPPLPLSNPNPYLDYDYYPGYPVPPLPLPAG